MHYLSYHFVLGRRGNQVTNVAGFRLTVLPTVFHPRYFLSSGYFATFIADLDLRDKRVADVGTGTGLLALAAARSGAMHVVATDINPNAAQNAVENARANGFGGTVSALCSNLLSAIAPGPWFDVILSSPPKHAGEARDLADQGWHAGTAYRNISALFAEAHARLAPGGRMYVMLSSDTDLALFGTLFGAAGFAARLVFERSIVIESFVIYELTPV